MKLRDNPVILFFYRWAPPFLMMGVIFWFSSLSDLPGAGAKIVWWDFIAKKTAHILEYALLFYSWQRALTWHQPGEKSYLLPFTLTLLYAISDEIHQSFTPTRHPQIRDIGFDMLGGFLVYLKQRRFI